MLRSALGTAIAGYLEVEAIIEVMLNPNGRLWIDRLSNGLIDTGETLSAADGERIVRLVAHHVGAEVHAGAPRVPAKLPGTGERFEGLLPLVVAAPAFAIRKPAIFERLAARWRCTKPASGCSRRFGHIVAAFTMPRRHNDQDEPEPRSGPFSLTSSVR
jgi:hypothetical protein